MRLNKVRILTVGFLVGATMILVVWQNLPNGVQVHTLQGINDDTDLSTYRRKIEEITESRKKYDYSHPTLQKNHDSYQMWDDKPHVKKTKSTSDRTPSRIICDINQGDATVLCLRQGSEIYVPFFSFLNKYFELYGEVKKPPQSENSESSEKFYWRHSYSKFYPPKGGKYTYRGPFMSFDHYNVENRERVKFITADEGIPLSTQWSAAGYPYPIQIAQYGLSHYSKHVLAAGKSQSEANKVHWVGREHSDWTVQLESKLEVVSSTGKTEDDVDSDGGDKVPVFEFFVPETAPKGIRLPLGPDVVPVKCGTLLAEVQPPPGGNFSLTVQVKTRQFGILRLHYCLDCANKKIRISPDKKDIYYSLGTGIKVGWKRLARNLAVDIRKALTPVPKNKKERRRRQKLAKAREESGLPPSGGKVQLRRVQWMSLRGRGKIRAVGFAHAAHMWQSLHAADWLVYHQDRRSGGWSVPVRRKVQEAGVTLAPGWLSGMAQGQAMSMLVRAWAATKQRFYLQAALSATKPLTKSVSRGGVRTYFLNNTDLPWYEEYPTQPSLFVLNGFIYSLLGLRDLHEAGQEAGEDVSHVNHLLSSGLHSLATLLPLFDAGSGSFYDLRHLTLRVAPRLARWDYHATHVTQLLLLAKLEPKRKLWRETARRWIGYFKGKRVKHN